MHITQLSIIDFLSKLGTTKELVSQSIKKLNLQGSKVSGIDNYFSHYIVQCIGLSDEVIKPSIYFGKAGSTELDNHTVIYSVYDNVSDNKELNVNFISVSEHSELQGVYDSIT